MDFHFLRALSSVITLFLLSHCSASDSQTSKHAQASTDLSSSLQPEFFSVVCVLCSSPFFMHLKSSQSVSDCHYGSWSCWDQNPRWALLLNSADTFLSLSYLLPCGLKHGWSPLPQNTLRWLLWNFPGLVFLLLASCSQSPLLPPLSLLILWELAFPNPLPSPFILYLFVRLCPQHPSKTRASPKYVSGEAMKPDV